MIDDITGYEDYCSNLQAVRKLYPEYISGAMCDMAHYNRLEKFQGMCEKTQHHRLRVCFCFTKYAVDRCCEPWHHVYLYWRLDGML